MHFSNCVTRKQNTAMQELRLFCLTIPDHCSTFILRFAVHFSFCWRIKIRIQYRFINFYVRYGRFRTSGPLNVFCWATLETFSLLPRFKRRKALLKICVSDLKIQSPGSSGLHFLHGHNQPSMDSCSPFWSIHYVASLILQRLTSLCMAYSWLSVHLVSMITSSSDIIYFSAYRSFLFFIFGGIWDQDIHTVFILYILNG